MAGDPRGTSRDRAGPRRGGSRGVTGSGRLPRAGSVLGVDVGCSPKRRSGSACRLDWDETSIRWRIERFRAVEPERAEILRRVLGGTKILAAAFDGPLRPGLDLIGRYRTAERLLTRKLQPLIGKPGQSSAPIGRLLNKHANICASNVIDEGLLAASPHRHAIHEFAIAEAFPSSFLGVLIEAPGELGARRGDRSDTFYRHLSGNGRLQLLLDYLLPGRAQAGFAEVTNHDDRAAVVCALSALCVAARDYTVVGDFDGWIVLPPRAMIQGWAWDLLAANAAEGELSHEPP